MVAQRARQGAPSAAPAPAPRARAVARLRVRARGPRADAAPALARARARTRTGPRARSRARQYAEVDKKYELGARSTAIKNRVRAALPRARALAVELYESPAGKLGSIVLGVWFITSGAFFLVLQLGFIALWLAPFWAPLLAKNIAELPHPPTPAPLPAKNIDVVRAARERARARASLREHECALTPARPIAHANAHTRLQRPPRGAQSGFEEAARRAQQQQQQQQQQGFGGAQQQQRQQQQQSRAQQSRAQQQQRRRAEDDGVYVDADFTVIEEDTGKK